MIRGSGFIFLAFVFAVSAASAADDSSCREQFANLNLERIGKKQFTLNKIPITGAADYSLASVREALGLTDSYLERLGENAKILSVGEGISPLTPFLRKRFAKTRALDLWYDETNLPEELATYVSKNRPHLIAGSALDIPLPDKSQNLVVSNLMINNFKEEATRHKAFEEIIRVLAPGGEARITVFGTLDGTYFARLRKQFGSDVTIEIEPFSMLINDPADAMGAKKLREGRRIVIQRNIGGWD